jgi:formylmethanofuran dehydrogenase subunit E-like metal-binding protein
MAALEDDRAQRGHFHFFLDDFTCSDALVPAFIGLQKNAGKVLLIIWLWPVSMLHFNCTGKKRVKRIRNDAFARM